MGSRLTRITTKGGDNGTTGLGDGSRVDKDNLRIAACGTVDELNSVLGVVLAEAIPAEITRILLATQHDLFDLGGELCTPGREVMTGGHLSRLDEAAALNADLPSLKEFILPGGCRAAAAAHVARTVCRRAERTVVALSHVENVSGLAIQYLNRLSDVLFIMCRILNRSAEVQERYWRPGHNVRGA